MPKVGSETMFFEEYGVRLWFRTYHSRDSVRYELIRAMVWSGHDLADILNAKYARGKIDVRMVDTMNEVIAGVWDDD